MGLGVGWGRGAGRKNRVQSRMLNFKPFARAHFFGWLLLQGRKWKPLCDTKIGIRVPLPPFHTPPPTARHLTAPGVLAAAAYSNLERFPSDEPEAPSLGTQFTSAPLALPKQKWPGSKSEIGWKKLKQDAIFPNFQEGPR